MAEFAAVGDDPDAEGAALADGAAEAESAAVVDALGAALAVADADGATIPVKSSGTGLELFEQASEQTEMRNANERQWEGRKVGEA